ncbi:B3 domain-containing protein Os12g0592300-like isoform X2 [Carex rostrata]
MHFYKQMTLPDKLIPHIPEELGSLIKLKRPSGATWHVGLTRLNDKLVIQPGWEYFINTNGVQTNDLLVFKYVSGIEFEVLIFDPWGWEKSDIDEITKNTSTPLVRRNKSSMSEPETAQISDSETPAKNRPNTKSRKRKEANTSGRENSSNVQNEMRIDLGQVVVFGADPIRSKPVEGCSTGNFLPGIGQLSCAVQGNNPTFVQVLKPSSLNIQCGISVPKKFSAEHLPKESQDLVLFFPEKSGVWVVRYFYSQHQQFIRYAGWGRFVNENNLQEGDTCSFELIKILPPITFVVRVSRAS